MIQENFDGSEQTDRGLFRVGGISAYIQLVCVTGTISVGMLLGIDLMKLASHPVQSG